MKYLGLIANFILNGFVLWILIALLLRMFPDVNDREAWAAIGLGWVLAGAIAWTTYRKQNPALQKPGLCPHCGYDLRATPERCPECGKSAGKK